MNNKLVNEFVGVDLKNLFHSTLIKSQKVMGWLSKKIDIQGAVFFCERSHTYRIPSEQKCAATR